MTHDGKRTSQALLSTSENLAAHVACIYNIYPWICEYILGNDTSVKHSSTPPILVDCSSSRSTRYAPV